MHAIEEEYLDHSGVKGMKWGVWNAETRKKYAGGSGRGRKGSASGFDKIRAAAGRGASKAGAAVASGAKKAGGYAVKSAKSALDAKLEKRRTEAKVNQMMDAAGLKKKRQREEFLRTRQRTLASHDPDVVFKGAHTLTDSELEAKIKRINQEGKLLETASNRKKAAAGAEEAAQRAAEARERAKQQTLGGRIASAAISTVSESVKDAGRQTVARTLDIYMPKPEKSKDKQKDSDIKELAKAIKGLSNDDNGSEASGEKRTSGAIGIRGKKWGVVKKRTPDKLHDEVNDAVKRSDSAASKLASLASESTPSSDAAPSSSTYLLPEPKSKGKAKASSDTPHYKFKDSKRKKKSK